LTTHDDPRRDRARQRGSIRSLATGLLIAMALSFVAARWLEADYPMLSWARAFAEAAMVGALADWFAVTALFRHPLGIPIPHTAVVPRNKDRIARNLGTFVERNFLAPAELRGQLETIDFAAALAGWLEQPERPQQLARHAAALVPVWVEGIDEAAVRARVDRAVAARTDAIDASAIVASLLETLTAEGRHRPLLDRGIEAMSALLAEYEPAIRARVRDRTSRLWRTLGVDEAVADRLISAAEEVISEMTHDPEHPWRRRFDEWVAATIVELRQGERYRETVDTLKREIIDGLRPGEVAGALWNEARQWLRDDSLRPDSRLASELARAISGIGAMLREDAAARDRANQWLRRALLDVVAREGHRVSHLIAQTMRRWDAGTFTTRIESHVGDDLQFIRINGTLIGGLVGTLLHAAGKLFAHP
jgi:uncharacterized membrane-anchored protein YjiN (DUF445 family)